MKTRRHNGVMATAHEEDLRLTPSPVDVIQNIKEAANAVRDLHKCRSTVCTQLRAKLRYLNAQARDLTEAAVRESLRDTMRWVKD